MGDAPGNLGVILTGGSSSRMGQNKAEMLFSGEPLLRRAVRRLTPAVDDMLVIGPTNLESLVPGIRLVADLVPGVGPLGGLYTALRSSTSTRIFLAACDMPFVQPGLVRAMLVASEANPDAQAIILRDLNDATRIHPLHAVYTNACLSAVERALASDNRSLRGLLSRLLVLTIDDETVRREDPRGVSAFNVNTPADWQDALRLANDEVTDSGA
jgi:molybdopterin-guanine dinucleotide biosynthesis protein A